MVRRSHVAALALIAACRINCITWYEAMAFCIWDGGYLPTEAEWDALRGGARTNGYPDKRQRNYIHGFRCARPM